MIQGLPKGTVLELRGSGHTLGASLSFDQREVPPEVDAWLKARGWGLGVMHPDSYEQLYFEPGSSVDNLFTWPEAVAYEFFRFINLGSNP